jgi:hypothetical protein
MRAFPDNAVMLSPDMLPDGRLRRLGEKGNLQPRTLDRGLARLRRPLDRAFERRAVALDALAALSEDVASRLRSRAQSTSGRSVEGGSPRVLVASLRGWSTHNAYELVIAQALRLRGARVALLTCGGGMPACELGWSRRAYPRPCDRCAWLTDRIATVSGGIERHRLGERLPWGVDARRAPREPMEHVQRLGDAPAGARVSAAWLLKVTNLERVPDAPLVLEDFAVALEGVERAAQAIFDELRPDVVFLLNGLFGAERTVRELALRRGVRAPTYEIAPRGDALVLSQRTPAPDYDVDRLWASVRDRPLSARQRAETVALLEDRARGIGAHESYYEAVEEDPAALRAALRLGERERVVSLFTNVIWDSATLDHDVGFASMFDWVEQAIRLAAGRELALVVRIHPGEARWGTREHVHEVVLSRLGELPANVRLVSPEDPLSSYALLDTSELLLTYTTTVGLEAATRGKRVAVAGATHYRGRGFTTDVAGPEDLVRVLAHPPAAPSSEEVELALRYAHMFFLRAMIPFPALRARGGQVQALPRTAAEIAPGADPYLDWICARILDGADFGLPDELACAPPASVAPGASTAPSASIAEP